MKNSPKMWQPNQQRCTLGTSYIADKYSNMYSALLWLLMYIQKMIFTYWRVTVTYQVTDACLPWFSFEALAREILGDLLEMSLLKNCRFLNMCLGISFVLSSDFTFSSLVPLMMANSGYDKSQAALAITINATAELASKILLAIFTLMVNVKSKYIFFIAMIAMAFAKVGYLFYSDTLTGTYAMIVVIGVVRSWMLVPQALVIIEDISIEKFASAYGIYGAISGIISILFGPIVGLMKDWTNSFVVCQLALIAMNVLFVIPWAIQFLSVDLPKGRKERAEKMAAQSSGYSPN